MCRHYRRGPPRTTRGVAAADVSRARRRRRAARRRARPACAGASTSGSAPELAQRRARRRADRDDPRAVERARGGEEEAHRRGGRERGVVGAAARPRARRVVERLGDRLVEREHLDLGAALAQRVGQHVAALLRAGDQRALHGDVARAPRRAPRRPPARARRRPRCRARAARARCPGRSRRPSRRRARARRGTRASSCSAPFGRRDADEVEAAEVGQRRRRAARCGSRAPRRRSAPSSRSRAASALACGARARDRDADARAAARGVEPARAGRQRRDVADERDRGRADPGVGRDLRDRRERARAPSRWSGSVPRSTTATGSSAGRPPATSCSAIRGERADAHVEDERARGTRRAPASRAAVSGFSGSSCPVTNATAAGELAVRDRDAGVGGRGDRRRSRPARPRTGCPRLAQRCASSPPRPNTNGSPPLSRTTLRPARRVLDQQPVDLLLRHLLRRRRSCRRRSTSASARAPSSASAGISRS